MNGLTTEIADNVVRLCKDPHLDNNHPTDFPACGPLNNNNKNEKRGRSTPQHTHTPQPPNQTKTNPNPPLPLPVLTVVSSIINSMTAITVIYLFPFFCGSFSPPLPLPPAAPHILPPTQPPITIPCQLPIPTSASLNRSPIASITGGTKKVY